MNKMLLISTETESFILQASQVPEQYPFVALVTYGGKLSEKYVGGTDKIEGGPFRVKIAAELLQKKASELRGKKVFASETLDSHSNSVCVGEFIDAWTEAVPDGQGNLALALKASGLFYRTRSPELVDTIVAEARAGRMGYSYDLKEVDYQVMKNGKDLQGSEYSENYLELREFQWRGATVLYRDAAAYQFTQLAAAAKKDNEAQPQQAKTSNEDSKGNNEMDEKILNELKASIQTLADGQKALTDKVAAMEAAGTKKTETPAAAPAPASKVTIEQLTASIATQVAEAMKPVIEGLKALTPAAPQRKTLDGLAAQMVERYKVTVPESGEITAATYQGMIESVQADGGLSKETKLQMIGELSSRKRALMSEEFRKGGKN